MNSPFVSASLRGASMMSSTFSSRRPFGPASVGDGAGRDQRRHAVGGRRAVAEVAAHRGAALDLRGADEVGGLDQTRPDLRKLRVLLQLGAGDGGADAEAAALLLDLPHLGDLLDVDDEVRGQDVRPHLDQQIGAAGQNTCHARLGGKKLDGGIYGIRRLVSHGVQAFQVCCLRNVMGGEKELHTARSEPTPALV